MSTVSAPGGSSSAAASSQADSRPSRAPHRRRGPRPDKSGVVDGAEHAPISQPVQSGNDRNNQRRRRPPPRNAQDGGAQEQVRPSSAQSHVPGEKAGAAGEKKRRQRRPRSPQRAGDGGSTPRDGNGPKRGGRRGARFGAGLTEDKGAGPSHSAEHTRESYAIPKKDDLTSTLIHDLSTPPYPDCLICFSAIRPQEPTFSCSPTIPIASEDEEEKKGAVKNAPVAAQCCWTTFHLKCIKAWASKSVKDTEAAWKARGEDRPGVWRCPGCQSQRNVVPTVYRCVAFSVGCVYTLILHTVASAVLWQNLDLLVLLHLIHALASVLALAHVHTHALFPATLAPALRVRLRPRSPAFAERRPCRSAAGISCRTPLRHYLVDKFVTSCLIVEIIDARLHVTTVPAYHAK